MTGLAEQSTQHPGEDFALDPNLARTRGSRGRRSFFNFLA